LGEFAQAECSTLGSSVASMKGDDSRLPAGSGQSLRPRIVVMSAVTRMAAMIIKYLSDYQFDIEYSRDFSDLKRCEWCDQVDLLIFDAEWNTQDVVEYCQSSSRIRPRLILLSYASNETDCIKALEDGVDDFIKMPCNLRELAARVKAVLRRKSGPVNRQYSITGSIEASGWCLDVIDRKLRSPDRLEFSLTPNEITLMQVFIAHPREIISREKICELATMPAASGRATDVIISRLRRTLRDYDSRLIKTVRLQGYVFDPPISRV
jgi:two-component system OmpR family response regulator